MTDMNDKVLDYATKLLAYRKWKEAADPVWKSMMAARRELDIDSQLDAEEWADRVEEIANQS